ncbi:hypothetical protein PYW07_005541 [Mythimna separata]|uniref:Acyltransferase 3 domain-containing protein n=1 Tax=Mythimna separata TaxID=271217 RepID=A0AAD7YK32_MYTSE|nr:hypothetical protein PYW07_005541 [Mythimna separata]
MFRVFFLFVLVQSSRAVIYSLNDTEYDRMPHLYHMDGYEECFDEPDAMFCYGEFVLVSDEPSELLTMIQEFSDNYRHYNHTLLRYGYCMKKTCNEFYNGSTTEVDLRSSFEACSNKTIYDKYKLKTRLTKELDCSKRDRDQPIDNLDIFVGVVCILIVLANIIGSLCDRCLDKGNERGGLKWLYCFSCFRNWKVFVAPAGEGKDPRIKALKGIHGIRAINMCFVVITHSLFTGAILLVNPEFVEGLYEIKINNTFLSGPLIMQSFFLVSAFLLVYNWMMDSEKRAVSWSMLPQQIIMRWLRLTPAYALIIGLTTTWFTRLASGGPMWIKSIYNEAKDCRSHWWTHILYINNYVDRTNCMAQTWYIAADTQLYIFGVILFLLCRTNLTRKVILSLVFVIGIIIPMLHTYYENLTGILVPSPESGLNIFMGDPTFEKVFSRGHTNLPGFIIGMAMGYIIYYWQKSGGDPKQFQQYRYIYWALPMIGLLVMFSGFVFFVDGPPLPTYVHLLYAGLQKPAFALAVAAIIAGLVIQLEDLYRPILEWQPFVYIGRLSYSAFLIHIPFIRTDVVSVLSLQRITIIETVPKCLTMLVGIFIAAFFFCMMVEMPFANIVREAFKKTRPVEQKNETVKETKETENQNEIDLSQAKSEDGTTVIKMGTKI